MSEIDIPNYTEYDLNICHQCSNKFLMNPDHEICHMCLLKRDAFHYQRGLFDAQAWVKVTDRLPEKEGLYIVHAKCIDGDFVTVFPFNKLDKFHPYPVTHWREMPSPPEMRLSDET